MNHRTTRLTALFTSLVLALSLLTGAMRPAPSEGRVIVLGFDGADARTVRELMAERPADYPNFARLQEQGSFEPLEIVAPPESPVSWAALNTGQNPAKTGVPGFVRRVLNGGRNPAPGLGHLGDERRPVESFDNTPIPTWRPNVMAGVLGGGVFLIVLVLMLLVSRGRFVISLVLALLLGGAGAWAGHTIRGYLPETLPRSTNPNQARNLWDYAADAGVESIVIDAAQSFDMPVPEGARVLSGLGVPDARGKIGDWFIYTTNPDYVDRAPKGKRTSTAGTVYRVDDYDGKIQTKVFGPRNFWLEEKLGKEVKAADDAIRNPTISLEKSIELSEKKRTLEDELARVKAEGTSVDMVIEKRDGSALVRIGSQEQELAEGEWSEFFELTFELNWLIKVQALTRVRLVHLDDPHFEIFVNVLDIDPRNPPFWQSISQPHGFAGELAHECDMLYETYGWSTATMPFKDKQISPELLMEEVEFTLGWREELVLKSLQRDDWRLFMGVFSTTDRVQHMMYQFYDEQHPLYDAQAAARTVSVFGETIELRDAIPTIYRQMDRVVGRVLDEIVESGDTLIVCSDHGFQSFRRQVNINNWLAEKGYLAIKEPMRSETAAGLAFVDWSKTQAYSLGMGFIYLNLKGREPNGQVPQGEADALLARLEAELLEATDPDTGASICKEVYVTKDVHSGPYLSMEADLLLGFAPTYRISWSSTSGGISLVSNGDGGKMLGPICTDNRSNWSGGHVSVSLPDVAGVFFSNRKLADPQAGVKLLQLAPTALDLLGVGIPAEMDLGPVSFAD